tara:strand:- start:7282 stop:7638 length:357 start_codon:yes stop_codon:yes gene_type:complete
MGTDPAPFECDRDPFGSCRARGIPVCGPQMLADAFWRHRALGSRRPQGTDGALAVAALADALIARMAELAEAPTTGAGGRKVVAVRVPGCLCPLAKITNRPETFLLKVVLAHSLASAF